MHVVRPILSICGATAVTDCSVDESRFPDRNGIGCPEGLGRGLAAFSPLPQRREKAMQRRQVAGIIPLRHHPLLDPAFRSVSGRSLSRNIGGIAVVPSPPGVTPSAFLSDHFLVHPRRWSMQPSSLAGPYPPWLSQLRRSCRVLVACMARPRCAGAARAGRVCRFVVAFLSPKRRFASKRADNGVNFACRVIARIEQRASSFVSNAYRHTPSPLRHGCGRSRCRALSPDRPGDRHRPSHDFRLFPPRRRC